MKTADCIKVADSSDSPDASTDEIPGTTIYKHPKTLLPYKTRAADGVKWEETGVFNVERHSFVRANGDIMVSVVFPAPEDSTRETYRHARVRAATKLAGILREDRRALFLLGKPDFWTTFKVYHVLHTPGDTMVRFSIEGDRGRFPARGCAIKKA